MARLWSDFGYALRNLRRSPVFTIVAIASLALGIGANTAIFQLLDVVSLRSLPVQSPEQIAEVRIDDMTHARGTWLRNNAVTNPLWEEIRRRQQPFAEVFAWADNPINFSQGPEDHLVKGLIVSGNFFDALGVRPLLGRVFHADDDRRNCGLSAAVISYGFWKGEFGGDMSIIGRKVAFDRGNSLEILGVTPPGFFGLEVGKRFDVAVPICSLAATDKDDTFIDSGTFWWLTVMGRRKPGVSLAQADEQMQSVSPGVFEKTLPHDYPPVSVKPYLAMKLHAIPASGGLSRLRDQYSKALVLLLAIAGLVLLIACTNLASLMLARASAREREIAVRLAIGASRADLVQQLMVEGLALAIAGAGAALFLARELSRFLVAFLDSSADPISLDVHPDWRVFAFTAFWAMLTCLLFALVPALRATRGQASDALKSGVRGVPGRERFGLRRIMVIMQIALSLVLAVGALLFIRSLRNLTTFDAGFNAHGVLIANVGYGRLNASPERLAAVRRDLVERIRAVPGVDAAAETIFLPATGDAWTNMMWMNGSDVTHAREVSRGLVGTGYFRTVGTRLIAGREFDDHDTGTSTNVAIVSETFARVFSLGPNPVGQRFWIEKAPYAPQTVYEIVGVARDSKFHDLRQDFQPMVFLPMSQFPQQLLSGRILIRSSARLDLLASSIRRAIAEVSPNSGYLFNVFEERITQSLIRERLIAILSGLFGALAILLATVGLYGVISYMVARRTGEIGIRIALGASSANVVLLVLRETGVVLGIGLCAGTLLTLMLGHAASAFLFGLQASDPWTLATAAITFAMVGLSASYLPARKASTIAPAIALRRD